MINFCCLSWMEREYLQLINGNSLEPSRFTIFPLIWSSVTNLKESFSLVIKVWLISWILGWCLYFSRISFIFSELKGFYDESSSCFRFKPSVMFTKKLFITVANSFSSVIGRLFFLTLHCSSSNLCY